MTPDPTSEAVDRIGVSRTQSDYADVVNRRAWSELHALFLPDATVRIDTVTRPPIELVGPDALGEFIGAAVERFAFFEFAILNSRIEVATRGDPDEAVARIFMCEIRREVDSLDWSVAYGVYNDGYRRARGRWWFERRDYQSLTRTGGEVFAFPHHLGPGPVGGDPPGSTPVE